MGKRMSRKSYKEMVRVKSVAHILLHELPYVRRELRTVFILFIARKKEKIHHLDADNFPKNELAAYCRIFLNKFDCMYPLKISYMYAIFVFFLLYL